MSTNKITGMSASVIKNGKMVWAKAYGIADRKTSKPMTLNTLFALASVSKTITADAFMIEWEKGSFQLDQPINNYLPWTVANPNHTSTSITVRHLMTHLSSIDDNWDVIDANMVKGDSPIQMSTFLHDYLVPGSSNYYATKNFFTYAPVHNSIILIWQPLFVVI
ncbi:MAG TPA: serine hydrolase domain-containing protein [Bacteroidales bacterium]|nr:serine hydrolase domain-containing protein [Bacteroidales bacterium]